MKNIADINIQEAFSYIVNLYNNTTKKQIITFIVTVFLIIAGYLYTKSLWQKYSILKQAKTIITEISNKQKSFFEKDGKYKKDIFADTKLTQTLNLDLDTNDVFGISSQQKRKRLIAPRTVEDYNVAQSGYFQIEVDPDNACMVLKYKRNTTDKTIFYASFAEDKILCQGKKCFKNANNEKENLCYNGGSCFPAKLTEPTQRSCGDGNGTQTRKCLPSCNGGNCEEWEPCACKKGFEWNGTTCKQSQTEKDCTAEQCFNGIYCDDKEPLRKNIQNGECRRLASCQQNKGWIYTSWECDCDKETFCPKDEKCLPLPENKESLILPDNEGSCNGIYYTCREKRGWVEYAKQCVCNKPGTFWDAEKGEAKCSPCTKKPIGAAFTSAGNNKDNCSWKCENGYQERKGTCLKPTGQYLCAGMDLQICTDDFSKNRKIIKDAKATNEGQPCFVEDKDNILFYNKKTQFCKLCQCVELTNGNTH